jgi:hypothetical protein
LRPGIAVPGLDASAIEQASLDFIVPKGHSVKVVRLPSFVEGMDAGRYAVLSLRISEKRLIRPTATGIIPISVQPKSEPAAVFAATTTQTPKAINPTEIKYEERSVHVWSLIIDTANAGCLKGSVKQYARNQPTRSEYFATLPCG